MVYLIDLSIAQDTQHHMVEWLVNNKLDRIWKEMNMAFLGVLSQHTSREIEESHENPQVGIAAVPGWYLQPAAHK
jgi:hypothetical protein